ncbi:hypothetical protein Hanom_Chr06g00481721 [Helianthus anomalus]
MSQTLQLSHLNVSTNHLFLVRNLSDIYPTHCFTTYTLKVHNALALVPCIMYLVLCPNHGRGERRVRRHPMRSQDIIEPSR